MGKKLNKGEMAKILGFSATWLGKAIEDGLIPAPTHGEGGHKHYLADEVPAIRKAYMSRYDGLLEAREVGKAIGIGNRIADMICHGILTAPTHRVGRSRRRYYRVDEVPEVRKELEAYRGRRDLPPGAKKCSTCWRPAVPDHATCVKCAERNRLNQQHRRDIRLCTNCASPATRGVKCDLHAAQAILISKRIAEEHKAAGKCISCNEPPKQNSVYCARHAELQRQNALRCYRRRQRRKRLLL